ncbi:DUF4093 domain-containing protein [Subdoligranulum sp. DSM 109015]|uniref:DUF4093 domain-containing protein n=1 Tax=Gemmiger gallinarum TaxID=2779354 RepID=A0ABR9QZT7_9FIRM|nr:DUF4093 domain-containing protein [Gemmiger gallinarum]MBE5036392.1 DUF4093 domain-containing protein [Gemmiger gallinarum]
MKFVTNRAVVVEGKYDAARLAGIVEGTILTTDGFAIFRDKEMQRLFKRLARMQGLIVLTDSDAAGFRIRHFVTKLAGAEHVAQAYIPALPGKESRKAEPGKEGLLGVEGVSNPLILEALRTATAGDIPGEQSSQEANPISYSDLYDWGLSGRPDCAEFRREFLRRLGLPPRLSKKELLEVLNTLYTRDALERECRMAGEARQKEEANPGPDKN